MVRHRQASKTSRNTLYGLLQRNWGFLSVRKLGESRKKLPYGWGDVKTFTFFLDSLVRAGYIMSKEKEKGT